jgi:hypothetical protein
MELEGMAGVLVSALVAVVDLASNSAFLLLIQPPLPPSFHPHYL